SVVPPAGNEEHEALDPSEERAKKGEKGYLGRPDGQLHAATVGRHGDDDGAAVGCVEGRHWFAQSRGRFDDCATGTVWCRSGRSALPSRRSRGGPFGAPGAAAGSVPGEVLE